jgi:hypothetical protein
VPSAGHSVETLGNCSHRRRVSVRAEAAGTYVAAREQALRDDPEIAAIRSTAGTVEASTLLRRKQRLHDHELQALVVDPKDADDRAVERMVNAALPLTPIASSYSTSPPSMGCCTSVRWMRSTCTRLAASGAGWLLHGIASTGGN